MRLADEPVARPGNWVRVRLPRGRCVWLYKLFAFDAGNDGEIISLIDGTHPEKLARKKRKSLIQMKI